MACAVGSRPGAAGAPCRPRQPPRARPLREPARGAGPGGRRGAGRRGRAALGGGRRRRLGAALEAALPARPAVVKPNQAEAAATTGEVDPVASARALVAAGARAALISCGADGVVLVSGEGAAEVVRTARPGERLTGNPAGAGDAATAAVAAHLAGVGIPDHDALLRDVVAWSAAAVLSPLAGDLDPADVARQRPLVRLDGPPPTSA
ncbi:PfkB family carbohydrate kinase [Serinicoccus profundi]|uniref:PfkB family carbohydrate kinase n=1 Tax=Serinicoccus profundi TaxID=1078471 RepID=UPI0009DAED37|nr:PfkB family carbohydrate kinase [Serinicoccus profundi]